MLEGLRSRWTTPAEWTYLRPRCGFGQFWGLLSFFFFPMVFWFWFLLKKCFRVGLKPGSGRTHEDLVEEVLDELLLERSRGEEAVEIGAEELSN